MSSLARAANEWTLPLSTSALAERSRREVEVLPHQAADNHVDVRSVPGPQGPERSLIAINRAADDEVFVLH